MCVCLQTKRYADIIIPRGGDNYVAIDLLVEHIRTQLAKRVTASLPSVISTVPAITNGTHSNHNSQCSTPTNAQSVSATAPKDIHTFTGNIHVMPRTNVLTYLHTQVRDQKTNIEDFQFYIHRLSRLLLNYALDIMTEPLTVITPTNNTFQGTTLSQNIIGVSIVRSGEVLEHALIELLPTIVISKIVIQQNSDRDTGCKLYDCRLPNAKSLENKKMLLVDSTLATGNAACMAIKVLLDHYILEENIIFACLAASPQSLTHIQSLYPAVRIVTSWVDEGLDVQHYLYPGMGSCGDRYYGTERK